MLAEDRIHQHAQLSDRVVGWHMLLD